ncbi:MFS transporter [Sodalis sp. RH21]|uniref:MFS transporter n=1 Tax=unclassified Sodalis (in: enterobacteria) TaxID=2636512 RepID=UPI0039B516A0
MQNLTSVKPIGHCRYWALVCITLLLTLSIGDRATLSVAGPHMQRDLGLDSVQLGWLFSVFAWSYAIGHAPAGWLSDKLGIKKTILIALVLWSLITILMGFVSWFSFVFLALLVLRFILGFMEAPVTPSSGRVLAAWFPSQERGKAGAIFNCAQYLSLVIFTPLMGWLDHEFGWEHIFWVMGGLGIFVAIFIKKVLYLPTTHPSITKDEIDYIRNGGGIVEMDSKAEKERIKEKGSSDLVMVKKILKNRTLCGIFIGQYCIASITWFFMTWFPIYLVKQQGFNILQAGFIAAIPAISGCIGGVFSGFFSDWMYKRTGSLTLARKLPITIGLTLSALIIACNYTQSQTIVIVLMSLSFFGKGFGSLGHAVIADTAPREIVGLTAGIFGTIANCAGVITPVVIGYILSSTDSFEFALIYVGLHGVIAVVSYWVIVGKLQRVDIINDVDDQNNSKKNAIGMQNNR